MGFHRQRIVKWKTLVRPLRVRGLVQRNPDDSARFWNTVFSSWLSDNQIHTIERSAFHDLVGVEKLRLNNNQLRHLPDLLFSNMMNRLFYRRQRGLLGRRLLSTPM